MPRIVVCRKIIGIRFKAEVWPVRKPICAIRPPAFVAAIDWLMPSPPATSSSRSTLAVSELQNFLCPLRGGAIIHTRNRAQFFYSFQIVITAGGDDNLGSQSGSNLCCKNRNTSRALNQNGLAGDNRKICKVFKTNKNELLAGTLLVYINILFRKMEQNKFTYTRKKNCRYNPKK